MVCANENDSQRLYQFIEREFPSEPNSVGGVKPRLLRLKPAVLATPFFSNFQGQKPLLSGRILHRQLSDFGAGLFGKWRTQVTFPCGTSHGDDCFPGILWTVGDF